MRLQTISFFRTASIFALAIASIFWGTQANQALAQGPDGVKVAVIDMQEVLNDYYKTKIEIEKLNALIERRQKKIESLIAAQKEPIEKLGELKKKLDDSALAEAVKKEVLKEFQELARS